jgi:hypothetical protein
MPSPTSIIALKYTTPEEFEALANMGMCVDEWNPILGAPFINPAPFHHLVHCAVYLYNNPRMCWPDLNEESIPVFKAAMLRKLQVIRPGITPETFPPVHYSGSRPTFAKV